MDCSLTALDVIRLDHSLGYNSTRMYNLCTFDGDTLIYATGTLLHFYNINSGQLQCKSTTTGHGVGHIATHPHRPRLAVGEKGSDPPIVVWTWPELQTAAVLRGGGRCGYTCLSFNADGSLLASVSAAPDHLLTIWIWEEGRILLQAQAFHQQVHFVTFSQFYPDQLATCGVGHMKMWKMRETLTGLKLVGEQWRCGEVEEWDVVGAALLPDGRSATGSEWGNLLVWAGGALQLQVCRVGRLPAHHGPITQLVFHQQALLSAGLDGAIRAWHYESIEVADADEEDAFVEIEPMFELFITDGVATAQIISLVKASSDPHDIVWFVQDKAGAIWRVEISCEVRTLSPVRVLSSHSGPVVSIATSPAANICATLGSDSKIILYDYVNKTIITSRIFNPGTKGTCLIWLPLNIVPSGNMLLAGFSDGVLRLFALQGNQLILVEIVKPHTDSVVNMSVMGDHLMTAGADSTVFLLHFTGCSPHFFKPVGFCPTPARPTCVTWSETDSFLVGCEDGNIYHYMVTVDFCTRTDTTFRLDLPNTAYHAGSMARNEKCGLDCKKDSPGDIGIQFICLSADNSVRFGCCGISGLFQLDLTTGSVKLLAATGSIITSYLLGSGDDSVVLGLADGRVQEVNLNDEKHKPCWSLGAHDSDVGFVRGLAASWDNHYIISCGQDSAVFIFFMPTPKTIANTPALTSITQFFKSVSTDVRPVLSLEQCKLKEKIDAESYATEKLQLSVINTIAALREEYCAILSSNSSLPEFMRISREELVPDHRVVEHHKQQIDREMQLVFTMLGRDLERSSLRLSKIRSYFLNNIETLTIRVNAINKDSFIETFRVNKLPVDFFESLSSAQEKLDEIDVKAQAEEEMKLSLRATSTPMAPEIVRRPGAMSPDPLEGLMKQAAVLGDVARSRKLMSVWRQHEARRAATAQRRAAWADLMRREPQSTTSAADHINLIQSARDSLGDYNLKTSYDYRVPRHKKETTASKRKALLDTKLRLHNMIRNFNDKVMAMRDRKLELICKHKRLHKILQKNSSALPENLQQSPPDLPVINIELEYPEEMFLLGKGNKSTSLFDADASLNNSDCNERNNLLQNDPINVLSLVEKQNDIIRTMAESIATFDDDIRTISEEKVELEVNLKFLELHLLTMQREMLVLEQFESIENTIQAKSFSLLKDIFNTQLSMNELMGGMEQVVNCINDFQEKAQTQSRSFLTEISDEKCYEFLKKLYERKWTSLIVEKHGCGGSELEFDRDSIEIKSHDSRESELSLDEDRCPEDCDRLLYDRTIQARISRHKIETSISESKEELHEMKKHFEALKQQMLEKNSEYEQNETENDTLQREKQTRLNEIETVVVLRLGQLQNFKRPQEWETLENSLVFSCDVMNQLSKRVGELTCETQQQKDRHSQNQQHMRQLGVDIRHMNNQIRLLEKEKQSAMRHKFGCDVELNKLDEALVNRLVAEMHFIPLELQNKFEIKLDDLRQKLSKKIDAYTFRLAENTKRYNILTVLKDERNKLEDALDKQELMKCKKNNEFDDTYCEKLRKAVKSQEEKVLRIRKEIYCLRQKSAAVLPRPLSTKCMEEDSLWIVAPDNNSYEVSLTVWRRIQSAATIAQQNLALHQAGTDSPQAVKNLKKSVEEFLRELPGGALGAVWQELSKDRDCELSQLLEEEAILSKATNEMLQIVSSAKDKSEFFKE